MFARLSYLPLIAVSLIASCCAQNQSTGSAFSSSRYPGFTSGSNAGHSLNSTAFENSYEALGSPQHTPGTPYAIPAFPTADSYLPDNGRCQPQTCQPVSCVPCCNSPCDVCGRNMAFDVSSVFLFRNRPNNQSLVISATDATQQINASDFDFGMSPGIEAGIIGYNVAPLLDLEVRGTWLKDWTSTATESFTGTTVGISANPPLGTSGPRSGFALYDSRHISAEFNAHYRTQRFFQGCTVLLGLRAMRLDERLNITLTDPSAALPDELVRTSTNNRLVGLQLGVDKVFANNSNWCLKFTGRAGLYGNNGQQRTRLISLATPPVTFPAGGDGGNLAFQAELGITGKFRLSPCANLIASYRVMFLDGIALAPDQIAATNFLTGRGYDSNGSVLLHGATVGIEVVF